MIDVEAVRSEFPALASGQVFVDGPAGTQVPGRVINAIGDALVRSMSNVGGDFTSSRRSEATVSAARTAAADLIGGRPDEMVFGRQHDIADLCVQPGPGRGVEAG